MFPISLSRNGKILPLKKKHEWTYIITYLNCNVIKHKLMTSQERNNNMPKKTSNLNIDTHQNIIA